MVEYMQRQLLVDGRPRLLVSGEVHYFRLERTDWADRLRSLREAGCGVVATYIPWLVHELPDGSFDLTGRTRPELDLGAFLDLAQAEGLGVIARPGPFVMAELKNEGLPFRLYEQHPEVHPVTWDGARTPTRTVDYLAPAYLDEVRGWYDAVMPVLAARLDAVGGPVIGVQLDNEVGMLEWVTNSPDLTDGVVAEFAAWLRRDYDAQTLTTRYPVELTDAAATARLVRTPDDATAVDLMHDLGHFMRERFARYLAELRRMAEANGVRDVPFLVNVHGTSEQRGTFPIGISQLYRSYAGVPGMLAGSDLYLGELTVGNVVDLYLANAFMAAVNDADQPLTSLEFEAGTGDYDQSLSSLTSPEATALKTRLCLAQGNRLINYYLFAGGHNPPLPHPVGDGNDRIGFTGERHGFAAPVDPEGRRSTTYAAARDAIHAANGVEPLLAAMHEEHDGVTLGFVPDHFMTEYHHPGSMSARAIVDDLTRHRGAGPREVLGRALLLGGFSFPAVDLQAGDLDPAETPVLALASASYLAEEVQRDLARYVEHGGRLLLGGVLPRFDMRGRPCSVLADALGVEIVGHVESTPHYFPSTRAEGWAAPRAETRVGAAQLVRSTGPGPATPVLVDVHSGEACGLDVVVGKGRAVLLTCDYPCDLDLYRRALAELGVTPRFTHDAGAPGVVVTSTVDAAQQRLLHLINVAPYPASMRIERDGAPLFHGRRIELAARQGVMLPLDVRLDGGLVRWSTGEVAEVDGAAIRLRSVDADVVTSIETERDLRTEPSGDGVRTQREGDRTLVVADRRSLPDGVLTITLLDAT